MLKFVDFFFNCDHMNYLFQRNNLLVPKTPEHEAQAYTVSTFAAHVIGEHQIAKLCLAKARTLVGAIFDTPSLEAVTALALMSNCYKKMLDHKMCSHYAKLAWNLINMIDSPPINVYAYVLQMYCRYDTLTPDHQKAHLLLEKADMMEKRMKKDDFLDITLVHSTRLYAKIFKYIGGFIFYPTNLDTILHDLDRLDISENVRLSIMAELGFLQVHSTRLGVRTGFYAQHSLVLTLTTMRLLVEWKSGRLEPASQIAKTCLDMCRIVQNERKICVADFSHFCYLGIVLQFYCEVGNFEDARALVDHMTYFCATLGPHYTKLVTVFEKDFLYLQQKRNLRAQCAPHPNLCYYSLHPSRPSSLPQQQQQQQQECSCSHMRVYAPMNAFAPAPAQLSASSLSIKTAINSNNCSNHAQMANVVSHKFSLASHQQHHPSLDLTCNNLMPAFPPSEPTTPESPLDVHHTSSLVYSSSNVPATLAPSQVAFSNPSDNGTDIFASNNVLGESTFLQSLIAGTDFSFPSTFPSTLQQQQQQQLSPQQQQQQQQQQVFYTSGGFCFNNEELP